MANDLTGDFDIVAEFAMPAVNRLLAAMHRIGRFPHSAAMHVDDTQPPGRYVRPSAVEIIDTAGDPIVDPGFIRPPDLSAGELSTDTYTRLGGIVNVDIVGAELPPIVPSQLKGRAQLQLSPPSLDVVDGGTSRITVRLQIMSRYLPDPATSPIAEFILARLEITAPVSQVASQVGNVLAIDIKANSVQAAFTPIWSSAPLTAEDRAGIDLLIHNALKTSFLPSNVNLPSNIQSLAVKALTSAQDAVAVLLKTTAGAADAATVNNVFLGAGDDFAFAAGVDFIRGAFQPTIDQILSRPVAPVKFDISTIFHTFHITYDITLQSADLELETGDIMLIVRGHAHTGTSWLPDFDFTVRQAFTLQPNGATVDLVVGDVALDTSSVIVDQFKGGALSALTTLRDRALADSGAAATVARMLSAEENLGSMFRALLSSSRRSFVWTPRQPYSLAYRGVTIAPSGIVLHGALDVLAWPPAHVEFEQIPAQPRDPHEVGPKGPEYSAFKSWIPGGTIHSYEWKPLGQTQPGLIDEHTFVQQPPPPAVSSGAIAPLSGFGPLCVTVRGSRLSSYGPVVEEPVIATVCGFDWFPVVGGRGVASIANDGPMVALSRPASSGLVEVVGHTPAVQAGSPRQRPNLVIHFADANSAARLKVLAEAVEASGRRDAVTSIVAVVASADLARSPYVPGIVYSEDRADAWERLLGAKIQTRPATFVINPQGAVAWRGDGPIDSRQLAAALRRVLIAGTPIVTRTLMSNVRIGQPPPNFLFDFAPGQQLTLNKLVGAPVVLVFWRSTSKPSVDAVARAASRDGGVPANGWTLLAINDGESADVAKRTAAEHRLPGILVTDPSRAIATAYGVNAWPLLVAIDAAGVINRLSYGTAGMPVDGAAQYPSRPAGSQKADPL